MPDNEKLAFAQRLKTALKRNAKPITTPTELAIQFSLRHPNDPITPQAAQKWLSGKARPRPDKMETLAEWLGVPAHWLSYGPPKPLPRKASQGAAESHADYGMAVSLSADEVKLVEYVRQLSLHQRRLLVELAEQLALERGVGGR